MTSRPNDAAIGRARARARASAARCGGPGEDCLRPGDILICEGGEVGRTAIWRGERPLDARISGQFFMYHMMNAFLLRRTYGVVGTMTTIAHLPGDKLRGLRIPTPPLREQVEIVRLLGAVDRKLDAEESREFALGRLVNTLLHELMTGKRRVVADLASTEIAEVT